MQIKKSLLLLLLSLSFSFAVSAIEVDWELNVEAPVEFDVFKEGGGGIYGGVHGGANVWFNDYLGVSAGLGLYGSNLCGHSMWVEGKNKNTGNIENLEVSFGATGMGGGYFLSSLFLGGAIRTFRSDKVVIDLNVGTEFNYLPVLFLAGYGDIKKRTFHIVQSGLAFDARCSFSVLRSLWLNVGIRQSYDLLNFVNGEIIKTNNDKIVIHDTVPLMKYRCSPSVGVTFFL